MKIQSYEVVKNFEGNFHLCVDFENGVAIMLPYQTERIVRAAEGQLKTYLDQGNHHAAQRFVTATLTGRMKE